MLIALAVPLAAAVNLVTLKHAGRSVDLIPAVLLGAIMSAAVTLPFALLLSRDLKRNARTLGAVAALMLAMQLVDLFWLIGPDLVGHGHEDVHLRVHWMDLAAALGLGGLWLFLFARQARTAPGPRSATTSSGPATRPVPRSRASRIAA